MPKTENQESGFTSKNLLSHGCSMTFGCELENPKQDAYPALIAKSINYNNHNLAIPGTSNDHIIKDILKYDKKIDLLLVGWTCETRFELGNYKGEVEKFGWNLVTPVSNKTLNKVLTTEYLNWDFYREVVYSQIILLQNYCEHNNIPYVFCWGTQNERTLSLHKKDNSYLKNQINWNRWFRPNDSFLTLTQNDFEYSWDYHPLEEGHSYFAKLFADFVKEVI